MVAMIIQNSKDPEGQSDLANLTVSCLDDHPVIQASQRTSSNGKRQTSSFTLRREPIVHNMEISRYLRQVWTSPRRLLVVKTLDQIKSITVPTSLTLYYITFCLENARACPISSEDAPSCSGMP